MAVEALPDLEADPDVVDGAIADRVVERLTWVLALPDTLGCRAEMATSETVVEAVRFLLRNWAAEDWARWGALFGWLFVHALGRLEDHAAVAGAVAGADASTVAGVSREWFDVWLLRKPVHKALEELGVAPEVCERAVAATRMLLSSPEWLAGEGAATPAAADDLATMLRRALSHRDVQAFLGVNRYEGVLWFNREAFQAWLWWLPCIVALWAPAADASLDDALAAAYAWVTQLQIAEETAGYQVDRVLAAIDEIAAIAAS